MTLQRSALREIAATAGQTRELLGVPTYRILFVEYRMAENRIL